MKRIFLLTLILLSIFSGTISAQSSYNKYKEADKINLLNYINLYRQSKGLPLVVYDPGLEEAARLQALDNYIKKKFRRSGDEKKLHDNALFPLVRDRVSAVGVPTLGESCAEICYARTGMNNKPLPTAVKPYQNLEQFMFNRYKTSPGHHAIMVTPEFTRVGMHTIYDGKHVYNAVVFMTDKRKRASRKSW